MFQTRTLSEIISQWPLAPQLVIEIFSILSCRKKHRNLCKAAHLGIAIPTPVDFVKRMLNV
ncbi:MAG: hypothetical protein DMF38_15360 [Verrucomicrobia bacterium]|nr:MAG: hypothetical protein DME78_01805 [Verrucomicrobiota bacterium]PYL32351.1 MAG: hypothetical protein DMF38_15360 [Verrucomicrobiota bacterium]